MPPTLRLVPHWHTSCDVQQALERGFGAVVVDGKPLCSAYLLGMDAVLAAGQCARMNIQRAIYRLDHVEGRFDVKIVGTVPLSGQMANGHKADVALLKLDWEQQRKPQVLRPNFPLEPVAAGALGGT